MKMNGCIFSYLIRNNFVIYFSKKKTKSKDPRKKNYS